MSWLRVIPWFIPWFAPWFGGDTQVAHPPLIPNYSNGPAVDHTTISLIPSYAQTDALIGNNVVSVNLSIANRCVAPDGFPRVAILAGKQGEQHTLPGPVISGHKGDRFLINVANELTDTSMFTGTTIHWHGIHQRHSNQMDGTAYVTQCPISTGKSFLYNFTGEDQVGTFWYHSHYAVQYCDGLRGPLIIRNDKEDRNRYHYDFDNDSTIITLMDWHHYPSVELPRQIWPDSVLINGTGCYDGLECPPPATYMVQQDKRYRFRILNMACKQYYNFSIDNHTMTVIEVDGEYVKPYDVDFIQIHAAQRYSFILSATQSVGNYWVRATPSQNMTASTTAILRYIGASEDNPQTNAITNNHLNETLLRSETKPPARLLKEDPDVRLNVVMYKNNWTDYNFLINGIEYTSPSVPVLLQIMNGARSWEIDPRESVYLLPRDMVVEITFHVDNTPGRPHPFHLHGHHFAVIKSADSEFRNPSDSPVMRDTVSTGIGDKADNVTIRFITDNPGPWILHCHNEWHLYAGMSIVFVEDYNSISHEPFNNATRELCPYNNPYETFTLPPPRSTAGPYHPSSTSTCTPTPSLKRGS